MTASATRGRPASQRTERRTEALTGYAFIAVPMTIFLVFNILAIVFAVFISLFDWGIRAGPREFLGIANYLEAFEDPIFWRGVWNTVRYAAIVVPCQMALGLFLAVIVNQKIRGRTFFRAAFYFPAIASSAAITVLFIYIMQPNGLFNAFLGIFGLNTGHSWLGHSSTALESIMALNIWTTSGTMMLFYLASLQTISNDVYEAAALDGANAWQTFWRVTFPLLKPGHYFVATISFIGALQVFDQAYIGGGPEGQPNNSLTTMVLFLYRSTFLSPELGYAAAIGVILFILIMAITLIQRRLFGTTPTW